MQRYVSFSLLRRDKIQRSVTFSSSGELFHNSMKKAPMQNKNRLEPLWFKTIIIEVFGNLSAWNNYTLSVSLFPYAE